MANLYASFGQIQNHAASGLTQPVMHGSSMTGLTTLVTSSTAGIVQSGGSDWQAPGDGYVRLLADGDLWISIGATPAADGASFTSFRIQANVAEAFSVQEGDKISAIDPPSS